MDLKELKREMPFKWRVQSCSEYGAKCVAYIDARAVQDILDDVCGQENWQVKYSEHKGNMFANIGIDMGKGWVWKSDCGTESNVEKQKGEASDAFKRAAVMWGVGRFLYSKKLITIKEVIKNEKTNKYEPASNGKKIWDITKHCNSISPAVQNTPAVQKEIKYFTKELDLWNVAIEKKYTIEVIKSKGYSFTDLNEKAYILDLEVVNKK